MTAILDPRADSNVAGPPRNAIKQFLALAPQNGLRVMQSVRVAVRSSQLTDDDLWRVIADNTDAMSVLIEKQFELDGEAGAPDPDTRQKLMLFNVQAIDNYNRQYRDCIVEIRRRYPSI